MSHTEAAKPLRILLVEDSEHDALAFRRALSKADFAVEISHRLRVEDIKEDIGSLASFYDIVVSDYKLPGATGLQLCKEILAKGALLPCVILTGSGSEGVAVKAIQAGVSDYLIKDCQQGYLEILPAFLPQVVRKYRHISKVKKMEGEQRKSLREWEMAMDASEDAIYLLSSERHLLRANKTFYAMTGSSPDEAVGKHIADIVHPQGEKVPCPVCQAQEDMRDEVIILEADHPDNPTGRVVEVTVTIVRDEEGAVLSIFMRLHDLTAKRQTEDELRRHRDRLKQINDIQQIFLTCHDDALYAEVLDYLTDTMACRFGYFGYINERGDLVCPSLTREIWEKCQVEDKDIVFPKEQWSGIWGESLLDKKSIYKNEDMKLPAGHVELTNALVVPILYKEELVGQLGLGTREGGFHEEDVVSLENIATQIAPIMRARIQKKQQEKKRQEAECLLRKARDEWEQSFNAINDIVTIQDPEMRIVRANKAACDFFEIPAEEIVGKFCHEVFRGISQPCQGCPGLRVRGDIASHSGVMTHESLAKTFYVSSAPICDDQGKVKHLVHTAQDITEQKKMEAELFQAHKMEAIGTLAGGIAHDFNNILTAVLGYAELAQMTYQGGDDPCPDIAEVISAGARAKELVQQILSFSRQREQETQLVSVEHIVKEALKLLRASLPASLDIEMEIAREASNIMADPTQVHQVIVNLCTNALHAMEDETGLLTVKLKRRQLSREDLAGQEGLSPGPFVELVISDTGHGMAEDVLDRIFEPYFTTKEIGQGTGLGLALVHGAVQSCGGMIRVESELGVGSTFHVYFPAVAREAVEVEEGQEELPRGTEKILVVDDENAIVALYKNQLSALGYTVAGTTSSLEALEIIRANPTVFDLIITDQTMPGVTGVKLAKEILALRPDLPIIICTGYSSTLSEEKALGAGIHRYLEKPVSREMLAMAIREALAKG
ncbi:MAG: response regulator [Thermodesulfobacteriota bacterium]